MEEENQTTQVENKSKLHIVTPFSKYLAMALFIAMPFIGGWLGYKFAPEKVIEKVVTQEVQAPERITVSRKELEQKEVQFMEQFGIEVDEANGTAPLYQLEDKNIQDTFVSFEDKGLSMLLPYNDGWGAPFYRFTPYDIAGDLLIYGSIHPCAYGCSGSGGLSGGRIEFHASGTTVEDIITNTEDLFEPPVCFDVAVNDYVDGTYCEPTGLGMAILIIKGSQHTYELGRWGCGRYLFEDDSSETESCKFIHQSIRVD